MVLRAWALPPAQLMIHSVGGLGGWVVMEVGRGDGAGGRLEPVGEVLQGLIMTALGCAKLFFEMPFRSSLVA